MAGRPGVARTGPDDLTSSCALAQRRAGLWAGDLTRADATADPLLQDHRWSPARVRDRGSWPATREGGELAEPCRVRLAHARLATIVRAARPASPIRAL